MHMMRHDGVNIAAVPVFFRLSVSVSRCVVVLPLRAWKDTAIALASCFRRLRCLAGCTDAGSCVDGTTLSEAWDAIEGAVTRRCLLGEVFTVLVLEFLLEFYHEVSSMVVPLRGVFG